MFVRNQSANFSNYAGQCKANAIELARFAEPQPVLAILNAKVSTKKKCIKEFYALTDII